MGKNKKNKVEAPRKVSAPAKKVVAPAKASATPAPAKVKKVAAVKAAPKPRKDGVVAFIFQKLQGKKGITKAQIIDSCDTKFGKDGFSVHTINAQLNRLPKTHGFTMVKDKNKAGEITYRADVPELAAE